VTLLVVEFKFSTTKNQHMSAWQYKMWGPQHFKAHVLIMIALWFGQGKLLVMLFIIYYSSTLQFIMVLLVNFP